MMKYGENMKIGIVTPYHSNFGGGEVFIESLNSYINTESTFDSFIFTSDREVFKSESILIPNINSYKNLSKNLFGIIRVLKKQSIDIVIINDVFLATFSCIFKFFGFRTVSLLHLELSNVKCSNALLSEFVVNMRRHLISLGSNTILSVNKTNINYLSKKAKYVGNFVDYDFFSAAQGNREHAEYDFIYVGRLVEVKNVEQIVGAFDEYVRKFDNDSKMLIVGEGPQKKEIIDIINSRSLHNNVRLQGFVHRDKIRDYYMNAKVCILLSLSEGFPTVLLEAMATGMPCISTNVGSCSEIVGKGTGAIVKLDNNSEIASIMYELVSNCEKYSDTARLKSREYASDVVLEKLVGDLK